MLVFCSIYCIRFINFCLPESHRNRVVIIEARSKVVNDRRGNVKSQGHPKVTKITEIVLLAVNVVRMSKRGQPDHDFYIGRIN